MYQIQSQLNKALDDMSASLFTLKEGMSYTTELPSKGLSQAKVMEKIKEYDTLSKSSFSPEIPASLSVFLIFIADKKTCLLIFQKDNIFEKASGFSRLNLLLQMR